MKKILLLIMLACLLLIIFSACDNSTDTGNETYISNCCFKELGLDTIYTWDLELIDKEDIDWSEWQCWNYYFTIEREGNTETYLVSVLRNDEEIHYVDLIEKIN